MGSGDKNFSFTGYEPKDYFLTETHVQFNQESVTEQRFSEQRFPEDMDYDDAAVRCSLAHTEDKSSTPNEKACRLVCRRRQCLKIERGNLLADCQAEIRKHEFLVDYDRRSIQKLSETIESQQEELHRAQAEERRRRDQQLLHEQLLKQNWDLLEAHENSLKEMEELKKFQSSTFDTVARRRLVEDQDTILELTGKIQELQNEIDCMNDSRDFQDAESVRSGHSHVTSQPVSFPPHPIPGGMLSRSFGMPSPREGPPSTWDTHGISGNVFASPVLSSTAPSPQELNPWSSGISEPIHSSTVEESERQTQDQDQRCQSGPSAKNSVIFSGGDSSAHSTKAQGVHTTTKNERKNTNRPAQSTKTCHASFSLIVSSHHNPSTVRGEHSCRDSGPLGSITPLPGLVRFLAQHVQGHVAAQGHLSQLPILQENRDLVTRPTQPDDVQRFVPHIAFSRVT